VVVAHGREREEPSGPLNPSYQAAFERISADPNNELAVMEAGGAIAGMLQLTFIPCLTHTGSTRCLIEGVRIHKAHRGKGLGKAFIEWAIERARERGCGIVQLTTDKQRPDAIRFYESLGFRATHEGFKLKP
jgi:GNAT superfamily N-acetyltransferase